MNESKSRNGILESEGWNKQFIACEPRLSEAVEMYLRFFLNPFLVSLNVTVAQGTKIRMSAVSALKGLKISTKPSSLDQKRAKKHRKMISFSYTIQDFISPVSCSRIRIKREVVLFAVRGVTSGRASTRIFQHSPCAWAR
jgi:hypothetical protein